LRRAVMQTNFHMKKGLGRRKRAAGTNPKGKKLKEKEKPGVLLGNGVQDTHWGISISTFQAGGKGGLID